MFDCAPVFCLPACFFPLGVVFVALLFHFIILKPDFLCNWVLDLISHLTGSPYNLISVIIYSLSRCPKPVFISFLCWTQNKIFWWIWVTYSCWSTLTLIVGKIWKSRRISDCLVFLVPQNSIYVQQKKETHLGLKQLLSKWWYTNKTPWQNQQTDGIIFNFGWTIPLTLIKQQNTEKNHSLFLTEKL